MPNLPPAPSAGGQSPLDAAREDLRGRGRALSWDRRGAVCGECATTVSDDADHCAGCGQSTGRFEPVGVVARVVADPAGLRLHMTQTGPAGATTTTRALTNDQARALARPWSTVGSGR